ncbi:thioesterase II family protein [Micromonospora cathayae]|uniref:Alpha/beta fold hydrolase n=1 Tax=Micromonospora cathayae TaxID=3028804 RepID=A0ABY7ZU19_9ACTN|nr:alpha/beta fold hydrolase [Micromonospora sp. HUAS 3]WDZ86556.1 alpha/beta fold hydrolase [Micromonospora sp. HUAS 3]
MIPSAEGNALWLRTFQPAPAAPVRLVCLPHAGGSASFFVPVARALAPAVEVVAVQYPGRQDRRSEPGIESLVGLADTIATELRALGDRPLALFGHSMGATVGFEVARLLEEAGSPPVRLFASGRRAPAQPATGTEFRLDDESILADLRQLSGTDSRVLGDDELLRLAIPTIRADYAATAGYRFTGRLALSCPITVLTGDDDPKLRVDEADDWAQHTTAGYDLHVYPGGHFYLVEQQAAVLALIAERLASAAVR